MFKNAIIEVAEFLKLSLLSQPTLFIFILGATSLHPPSKKLHQLHFTTSYFKNSCCKAKPPKTHTHLSLPSTAIFDRLQCQLTTFKLVYIIPPPQFITKNKLLIFLLTLPPSFIPMYNSHILQICHSVLLCNFCLSSLVRNFNYSLIKFWYTLSFLLFKDVIIFPFFASLANKRNIVPYNALSLPTTKVSIKCYYISCFQLSKGITFSLQFLINNSFCKLCIENSEIKNLNFSKPCIHFILFYKYYIMSYQAAASGKNRFTPYKKGWSLNYLLNLYFLHKFITSILALQWVT